MTARDWWMALLCMIVALWAICFLTSLVTAAAMLVSS